MSKHTADNTYKVEGSHKRKINYDVAKVISAIVLAALVTLGIMTISGIVSFINLTAVILGIIYAGHTLITNVIASKNVEPPLEVPELF